MKGEERRAGREGRGGESQGADMEPLPTPSPPCPSPLLPILNTAGRGHLIVLGTKCSNFSMNAGTLEHFFTHQ